MGLARSGLQADHNSFDNLRWACRGSDRWSMPNSLTTTHVETELEPRVGLQRPHMHLVLLLAVISPLFILNARWGIEGNADAVAAAIPAWSVAEGGTLDLSEYPAVTDRLEELDRWFVETESGTIVSNRAPGLIGLAIPAYWAFPLDSFQNGPATFVALTMTTLAVVLTWYALRRVVSLNSATLGVLALALGTTTWWVSSSELWPHGPGQLWAAIAILSLSAASLTGSGFAFAASITTRPLTSLFALFTGSIQGFRERRWRPVVVIGALSALGFAAVMGYNRVVFGLWTPPWRVWDRFH